MPCHARAPALSTQLSTRPVPVRHRRSTPCRSMATSSTNSPSVTTVRDVRRSQLSCAAHDCPHMGIQHSCCMWLVHTPVGRASTDRALIGLLPSCAGDCYTSSGVGGGGARRAQSFPVPTCVEGRESDLGFDTGRQKMALERGTNPKLSRRACSPRYGLQSCPRKSAGVAKRPRELP
jgi:hypothetical protein